MTNWLTDAACGVRVADWRCTYVHPGAADRARSIDDRSIEAYSLTFHATDIFMYKV